MKHRAFTLVELLVVVAIIALLVAILLPSLGRARDMTKNANCMTNLRGVAMGTFIYTQNNKELFPRSQMTASYSNVQPWEKAIIPELGGSIKAALSSGTNTAYLNTLINGLYRCPSDTRPLATTSDTEATYKYSYGQNSSFELDAGDSFVEDYPGKPRSWHRVSQVPKPSATIFYGELAITTVMNDHFMPYYWHSDANAAKEIDGTRHRDHSNYVYVDMHVTPRKMEEIFKWDADQAVRVDQFNPYLAH